MLKFWLDLDVSNGAVLKLSPDIKDTDYKTITYIILGYFLSDNMMLHQGAGVLKTIFKRLKTAYPFARNWWDHSVWPASAKRYLRYLEDIFLHSSFANFYQHNATPRDKSLSSGGRT